MTDEEFEDFFIKSHGRAKQKAGLPKVEYALGTWSRWWFDQTTEKLQFFDKSDNLVIEADVLDIGSYSPKSITWKWAWGNTSVLPGLRKKAGAA